MKILFNYTYPDILMGGKKVHRLFSINEGGPVNSFGIVIGTNVFDIRIFGHAWIWNPGKGWRKRI